MSVLENCTKVRIALQSNLIRGSADIQKRELKAHIIYENAALGRGAPFGERHVWLLDKRLR